MFLHLYAQPFQHADGWIVGDVESLKALRDAIDRALADDHAAVSAMTADGEEYPLLIVQATEEDFGSVALPYGEGQGFSGKHPFKLLPEGKYRSLVLRGEQPGRGQP